MKIFLKNYLIVYFCTEKLLFLPNGEANWQQNFGKICVIPIVS